METEASSEENDSRPPKRVSARFMGVAIRADGVDGQRTRARAGADVSSSAGEPRRCIDLAGSVGSEATSSGRCRQCYSDARVWRRS
jgi:hypothetical protein